MVKEKEALTSVAFFWRFPTSTGKIFTEEKVTLFHFGNDLSKQQGRGPPLKSSNLKEKETRTCNFIPLLKWFTL